MSEHRRDRGLPIGPGHVLYPMLVAWALAGLMFGAVGKDIADDMPEEKSHPYFPDHVWPYAVLGMVVLVTLGLLAVAGRPLLNPGAAADPRAAIIPRPEWYFLALFQLVKLGPALLTSIVIPGALVLGLLFWPLLDERIGPTLARRLGWRAWPVPKRNRITGAIWVGVLGIITALTLWALLWPQLCLPWFFNGPVCGS